jgi:hypothetical protein
LRKGGKPRYGVVDVVDVVLVEVVPVFELPPTGVVVELAGCPMLPVLPPCIIICSASGS